MIKQSSSASLSKYLHKYDKKCMLNFCDLLSLSICDVLVDTRHRRDNDYCAIQYICFHLYLICIRIMEAWKNR